MTDTTTTTPVADAAGVPPPEVDTKPTDPSPQDLAADPTDAALLDADDPNRPAADGDEGDTSDKATPAAAETVEIELDGVKHSIPKALHGAFLMQRDYTQKTQAVAEAARQIQEARAAFDAEKTSRLAAIDAEMEQRASVQNLRTQLKAWEGVRWDILESSDRENGTNEMTTALLRHTQLKDALATAEAALATAQSERTAKEQADQKQQIEAERAEDAKLLREGYQHLVQKIPDWDQVASKVATFGMERFGFAPAEINAVRDPRMFEVLHLAYLGAQKVQQAAATDRLAKTQQTTPAPTVPGKASAPRKEPLSTDEWIKWRQKQVLGQRTAKGR